MTIRLSDEKRAELEARLASLQLEHQDLDQAIAALGEKAPYNQLQLQRMKKRKLALKDEITKLEYYLLPDIIA